MKQKPINICKMQQFHNISKCNSKWIKIFYRLQEAAVQLLQPMIRWYRKKCTILTVIQISLSFSCRPIDPSAFDDDLAAAHLEDIGEAEPASTVDADASLDETLGWQMSEFEPALLWGLITMFVGFLGWVVARFWRPRVTYALTMVMSLAPLFTFFVYLDRLMPAL